METARGSLGAPRPQPPQFGQGIPSSTLSRAVQLDAFVLLDNLCRILRLQGEPPTPLPPRNSAKDLWYRRRVQVVHCAYYLLASMVHTKRRRSRTLPPHLLVEKEDLLSHCCGVILLAGKAVEQKVLSHVILDAADQSSKVPSYAACPDGVALENVYAAEVRALETVNFDVPMPQLMAALKLMLGDKEMQSKCDIDSKQMKRLRRESERILKKAYFLASGVSVTYAPVLVVGAVILLAREASEEADRMKHAKDLREFLVRQSNPRNQTKAEAAAGAAVSTILQNDNLTEGEQDSWNDVDEAEGPLAGGPTRKPSLPSNEEEEDLPEYGPAPAPVATDVDAKDQPVAPATTPALNPSPMTSAPPAVLPYQSTPTPVAGAPALNINPEGGWLSSPGYHLSAPDPSQAEHQPQGASTNASANVSASDASKLSYTEVLARVQAIIDERDEMQQDFDVSITPTIVLTLEVVESILAYFDVDTSRCAAVVDEIKESKTEIMQHLEEIARKKASSDPASKGDGYYAVPSIRTMTESRQQRREREKREKAAAAADAKRKKEVASKESEKTIASQSGRRALTGSLEALMGIATDNSIQKPTARVSKRTADAGSKPGPAAAKLQKGTSSSLRLATVDKASQKHAKRIGQVRRASSAPAAQNRAAESLKETQKSIQPKEKRRTHESREKEEEEKEEREEEEQEEEETSAKDAELSAGTATAKTVITVVAGGSRVKLQDVEGADASTSKGGSPSMRLVALIKTEAMSPAIPRHRRGSRKAADTPQQSNGKPSRKRKRKRKIEYDEEEEEREAEQEQGPVAKRAVETAAASRAKGASARVAKESPDAVDMSKPDDAATGKVEPSARSENEQSKANTVNGHSERTEEAERLASSRRSSSRSGRGKRAPPKEKVGIEKTGTARRAPARRRRRLAGAGGEQLQDSAEAAAAGSFEGNLNANTLSKDTEDNLLDHNTRSQSKKLQEVLSEAVANDDASVKRPTAGGKAEMQVKETAQGGGENKDEDEDSSDDDDLTLGVYLAKRAKQ